MKQRNLAPGGVRLSGGCAGACGGVQLASDVGSAGRCEEGRHPNSTCAMGRTVVPRRLGRVSVDLPPTGKVNSKPSHRGKVNSNRGKVRQTIYLLQAARTGIRPVT